jgi:hypothetical protein
METTFADPRLQAQYDQCLAVVPSSSAFPQVSALVALLDWLKLLEGQHSPSVHETLDQLRLPHRRLELSRWLQSSSSSSKTGPLREQLVRLAHEG